MQSFQIKSHLKHCQRDFSPIPSLLTPQIYPNCMSDSFSSSLFALPEDPNKSWTRDNTRLTERCLQILPIKLIFRHFLFILTGVLNRKLNDRYRHVLTVKISWAALNRSYPPIALSAHFFTFAQTTKIA